MYFSGFGAIVQQESVRKRLFTSDSRNRDFWGEWAGIYGVRPHADTKRRRVCALQNWSSDNLSNPRHGASSTLHGASSTPFFSNSQARAYNANHLTHESHSSHLSALSRVRVRR